MASLTFLATLCENDGMLNDCKFLLKLFKQKSVLISKKHFIQKCFNNKIIPKTLIVKLNNPISNNVKYILENCSLFIMNKIVKDLKFKIASKIKEITDYKNYLNLNYDKFKIDSVLQLINTFIDDFVLKLKSQNF